MTTRDIELPLEVDRDLREFAEWRGLTWNAVGIRSIHAAHYVCNQWIADRVIYQDELELELPYPKESEYAPMHIVRFDFPARIDSALKRVCDRLYLNQHSGIEWGMNCMRIIDDAMVLHHVSAKKAGDKNAVPYDLNH